MTDVTWKGTVAHIKMIRIFFQWFWTIIYNSSHPLGPVVVQFFWPTDGAGSVHYGLGFYRWGPLAVARKIPRRASA